MPTWCSIVIVVRGCKRQLFNQKKSATVVSTNLWWLNHTWLIAFQCMAFICLHHQFSAEQTSHHPMAALFTLCFASIGIILTIGIFLYLRFGICLVIACQGESRNFSNFLLLKRMQDGDIKITGVIRYVIVYTFIDILYSILRIIIWALIKIHFPQKCNDSCLHGAPLLTAFICKRIPFSASVSSVRHIQWLEVGMVVVGGFHFHCFSEISGDVTWYHYTNRSTYGCFLKWWYPTTMGFPTKKWSFWVWNGVPPF